MQWKILKINLDFRCLKIKYVITSFLQLLGLFFEEGNGNPLQYSCLGNPIDRGAWWLQSMGWRRVRDDWATSLSFFIFMHWRRKWQPTPVFLPGESQGWEPGGLPSMGLYRVRHDWHDLAVAAGLFLAHIAQYRVIAIEWRMYTVNCNHQTGDWKLRM